MTALRPTRPAEPADTTDRRTGDHKDEHTGDD
jgi:hypothetical protein